MVPDSAQKQSHSSRQRVQPSANPQPAVQLASEEGLESFRLEVTAGKKLRMDSGSLPANGSDRSPQLEDPFALISKKKTLPNRNIPKIQVAEKRFSQKGRKKLPSWVASLSMHGIVLLGLAFFTFSTLEQQVDFTLSMETEAFAEEEIELQEIVINPLDEFESDVNQLAIELQEASQVSASDLSAETALADLTTISGSNNLGLGELSRLFGTHGNGLNEVLPTKAKLTATFFETKIEGRRIVYVVDNSGGMQTGELETLIDELMRSVESLNPDQEF